MLNFFIGFVVGILIVSFCFMLRPKKYSGTFSINLTDDVQQPISLTLTENLQTIYDKKDISLKVVKDK